MRHRARAGGGEANVVAASAGTRPFRIGGAPHPGVLALLAQYGIDAGGLAGRPVPEDAATAFDRVIAVDRHVLKELERLPFGRARLELLLPYGVSGLLDVPDPFLDGGFERSFELIDDACRGLLEDVLAERGRADR